MALSKLKYYLPVLQIKINDKLMFPLCHTCALNENQQTCNCTDKDRILIHTWCTPEINLALNMGYILIEIYEIFNWSEILVMNKGYFQTI